MPASPRLLAWWLPCAYPVRALPDDSMTVPDRSTVGRGGSVQRAERAEEINARRRARYAERRGAQTGGLLQGVQADV